MYKKYKTIGIDLDNTVWNLGETVVNQINKKYNLDIDYNDCPYNLDETFNKYPQITDDINDLYYDAIAYVQIYKHALTAIEYLNKEYGATIYFCTSSTPKELYVKDIMLRYLFDWYDGTQLISCHYKHLLKLDVMIDDLWTHFGDNKLHLLYAQPYNKDAQTGDPVMHRCEDWLEVVRYIIEE